MDKYLQNISQTLQQMTLDNSNLNQNHQSFSTSEVVLNQAPVLMNVERTPQPALPLVNYQSSTPEIVSNRVSSPIPPSFPPIKFIDQTSKFSQPQRTRKRRRRCLEN
mgnify:CR=1 FL=1